jgi:hypothetical protein
MNAMLREQLKSLRLSGMSASLDVRLQDAEVIQITGRSYRLRGKSADEKEGLSAGKSKPAKPANGKSKSGQTRKPAQL